MADEGRSLALLATLTALCTVSVRLHAGRVVILSQRSRRVGACACLVRLLLGRQLLQQLEHELFAEAELPRVLLPLRPASTATVLSRQETPANRHSARETRQPGECSSEAGPAVARVSIAAGAVASAMAAESRGKPKIKGTAWRRPRGTGSAAGGE